MDIQKLLDTVVQTQAETRGRYHLNYGQLIKALEQAPFDAVVDERIKGVGSWRGSYNEIAIFTEEKGLMAYDEEFNGDYKDYDKWSEKHCIQVDELPTNANELAKLLRSLLGKEFVGYKGGTIQ